MPEIVAKEVTGIGTPTHRRFLLPVAGLPKRGDKHPFRMGYVALGVAKAELCDEGVMLTVEYEARPGGLDRVGGVRSL